MKSEKKLTDLLNIFKELKTVYIPLKCLETEEESVIFGFLSEALSHINQSRMEGPLQLIIAELLSNAEKTILKRQVFYRGSLYNKSSKIIDDFNQIYKSNISHLRSLAKKNKPALTFTAQLATDGMSVQIENIGLPSPEDDTLIKSILANPQDLDRNKAQHGLALSFSALKALNIDSDALKYEQTENKTRFGLFIPHKTAPSNPLERIDNSLIAEINELPEMPPYLQKIVNSCDPNKSNIRQVAEEIGKHQAIANEIIHLVNAGRFAGSNIIDILNAVKMIGLENIPALLFHIGAFEILTERYGDSEQLFRHSVQVGFYARALAKKFKIRSVAEQVYTAGLLHDIGKFMFYKRNKTIAKLLENHIYRQQSHLEDLTFGTNHAAVGGLLSEKWNFPKMLLDIIRHHHHPQETVESLRPLVYPVYLANAFADYQDGKLHYHSIEPDVLSYFNLIAQKTFEMVSTILKTEFHSASDELFLNRKP